MARRRRSYRRAGSRRRRGFTLPIAAIAGFGPLLTNSWVQYKLGGLTGATNEATRNLCGWDPVAREWKWDYMKRGTFPLILGLLAHRIIGGAFGVNRMLSQARVPFLRI